MMNDLMSAALSIAKMHPEIAGNPMADEWLQIIQNGDTERGEQVANNLLSNYGMTKDQGIAAALKFFGL